MAAGRSDDEAGRVSRGMAERKAARQEPRPTGPRFTESVLFLSGLLTGLEREMPRTWPFAPLKRLEKRGFPRRGEVAKLTPVSRHRPAWVVAGPSE